MDQSAGPGSDQRHLSNSKPDSSSASSSTPGEDPFSYSQGPKSGSSSVLAQEDVKDVFSESKEQAPATISVSSKLPSVASQPAPPQIATVQVPGQQGGAQQVVGGVSPIGPLAPPASVPLPSPLPYSGQYMVYPNGYMMPNPGYGTYVNNSAVMQPGYALPTLTPIMPTFYAPQQPLGVTICPYCNIRMNYPMGVSLIQCPNCRRASQLQLAKQEQIPCTTCSTMLAYLSSHVVVKCPKCSAIMNINDVKKQQLLLLQKLQTPSLDQKEQLPSAGIQDKDKDKKKEKKRLESISTQTQS